MWLDALAALVGAWVGVASVAGVAAAVAVGKLRGGNGPAAMARVVTPDIDVEQTAKDVLAALSKLDHH